jgi:T5SS/PEP-CTERM-associated repeat protein/autotransporter-associated beta strand protein
MFFFDNLSYLAFPTLSPPTTISQMNTHKLNGMPFLLLALHCLFSAVALTPADAQDLYVGNNSSGQTTNFTSGTNAFASTYVGNGAAASNNLLTVSNAGTLLTNANELFIGRIGSSNSMVISSGGMVVNSNGYIGSQPFSSSNSVLVTGSNSLWTNRADLYVGNSGSGNNLVVDDGGMVADVSGYIGTYSTSSNNSVQVTGTESLWTNSADLYVGFEGFGNNLTIANGATVANTTGFIGLSGAASFNNSVLVTGAGSLWTNSADLFVGFEGFGNNLTIANGGTVANTTGFIGLSGAASSNNSVLVTGAGSLWTNSNVLCVGYEGSSNSLVVSNGATVAVNADGNIGYDATASNNSVLVTGSNSLWTNSNSLLVGVRGSSNSLTISIGGTVANTIGFIGYDAASSNNSALVTGSNSTWSNSGSLYVGYLGSSNTLTVANSGSVVASVIEIAYQSGSSGTLNIGSLGGSDGAGTITANAINFGPGTGAINFNQTDSLTLSTAIAGTGAGLVNQLGTGTTILSGNNTYTGETVITRGTLVAASTNALGGSDITLGGTADTATLALAINLTISTTPIPHYDLIWGSNGVISLTPGAQALSLSGGMTNAGGGLFDFGGYSTTGTNAVINFNFQDGFTASSFSVLGSMNWGFEFLTNYSAGYSNSLVAWHIPTPDLYVGSNSTVPSTNFTSGTNTYGNTYVGYTADASNNLLTIGNTNTLLTNSGLLYVGYDGSSNSMVISNGGRVANVDGIIGLRTNSSNNSVLVTGEGSLWTNARHLSIGEGGSGNSLTVADGGTVASDSGIIGSYDTYTSSNNSVLVTGTGSLWTNSSDLVVGGDISGNSLVISNGGKVANTDGFIGEYSSNNSVLVTGSNSLWTNAGGLFIGNYGSGTLTIANSGSVAASSITIASQSNSTGTLNIGRFGTNDTAGTINAPTIAFGSGTGTINFNQSDSITIFATISGNGSVNQLGAGSVNQLGGRIKQTTILSGNNTYTGETLISDGTLRAASTNAFGTSAVTLTNSGTLSLSTNLTIASLIWGGGSSSVSVSNLTSGAFLNITGALTLSGSGTGTFKLGHMLGTNAVQLMAWGTPNNYTTNNFFVTGVANYSLIVSNNNSLWLTPINDLIAVSTDTIVTNSATYPSVSFQTNGILTVTPGVTLTITTRVDATNNGTVIVNGELSTPAMNIPIGGTLMGSGTLSLTGGNLTVNGTVAPGNSPGTFFVTGGNLVMGSTAIWDEQIYSTSLYDRVVVTGAAFLNGTMNITSYGSGGLEYGQQYNFLTASGGISGAFSSIIAPNGFRGRLLLSGNNTEANILIAPSSYTLLAQGNNQIQVATALDSFIPATSGDQLVVSTSLDSLTASEYNQAFNAIMPTMYQSMATVAFNQANALNMQLNQRLWGVRLAEGGGFSMSGLADNYAMLEGQGDGQADGAGSGKGVLDSKKDILRPGLDNHWGMFVDANGIFAKANSGNMLPGYNAQSGGITAGLTYKWNESFASGLYCGYQGTYSKMGANGSGLGTGSSLIDNAVRFGVFGTYGHKDGKGLYANALAGGAYHNYQATRVIQYTGMNRTANSAPGAGELDTMLATGYDIQKGKFTFGPTASLQYTYLGVNKVNETGAQSLNFNSGGWNSSSMLSSVGAHAAYNWQACKNVVVVPQISLNWQHEFLQNPYNITGNLGGTSPTFSNTSATGIRDYLYTGVGFTVELNKKWNTSFFYNAAAGNSDLVSQNIFWSAGVKF